MPLWMTPEGNQRGWSRNRVWRHAEGLLDSEIFGAYEPINKLLLKIVQEAGGRRLRDQSSGFFFSYPFVYARARWCADKRRPLYLLRCSSDRKPAACDATDSTQICCCVEEKKKMFFLSFNKVFIFFSYFYTLNRCFDSSLVRRPATAVRGRQEEAGSLEGGGHRLKKQYLLKSYKNSF